MRIPTDLERERLMHMYDAKKAHEYYIRTRELKGRKSGKGEAPAGRRPIGKKDLSRDTKFLKTLPLAQEGMPLPKVARVVKNLQSKSDQQLTAEIKRLKAIDAKSANPSPLGGIEAMTAERVLKSRGKDPRTGKTQQQIHKEARVKQRKELATSIKGLEDRLQKLEARIKERAHEEASEDRKSKAKKERSAKEKDKPKSAAEKAEAARENEKYRDKNKQKLKGKDKKDGSGGSKKDKNSSSKHSVSELKSLATKVKGQIAVAKQKLAAL